MNNNVIEHDWGTEIIWSNHKDYGAKLLLFQKKIKKTNFIMNKTATKSYFVNQGKFCFRWIDTNDGKIYQQEVTEGGVFDSECLKPLSIECITESGSISEAHSGYTQDDVLTVIRKENF